MISENQMPIIVFPPVKSNNDSQSEKNNHIFSTPLFDDSYIIFHNYNLPYSSYKVNIHL